MHLSQHCLMAMSCMQFRGRAQAFPREIHCIQASVNLPVCQGIIQLLLQLMTFALRRLELDSQLLCFGSLPAQLLMAPTFLQQLYQATASLVEMTFIS